MFFYRFNILKLKISKNNIYHAIKYALNMTWDFTYIFFYHNIYVSKFTIRLLY